MCEMLSLVDQKLLTGAQFRILFKSWSGVVMGMMLNFSTSTFRMLGVMNAGRLGPSLMSLMPK